jgi:hypothetical protein
VKKKDKDKGSLLIIVIALKVGDRAGRSRVLAKRGYHAKYIIGHNSKDNKRE